MPVAAGAMAAVSAAAAAVAADAAAAAAVAAASLLLLATRFIFLFRLARRLSTNEQMSSAKMNIPAATSTRMLTAPIDLAEGRLSDFVNTSLGGDTFLATGVAAANRNEATVCERTRRYAWLYVLDECI